MTEVQLATLIFASPFLLLAAIFAVGAIAMARLDEVR